MASSSIGIDLGGTWLRAAAVDAAGQVLASRRVATDGAGGVPAVIAQMEHLIGTLRRPDTVSIGGAIPGAVDASRRVVSGIPALRGWTDIPLAAILESTAGLPTRLENDAKAAAIGEWRAGAGKGFMNFAYVTVSTGIGGGIVVDGRLLRGRDGLAGEVGHTRIADDTAVCSCGHRGCWEAVASGTALGRAAAGAAADHPGSVLAGLVGTGAVAGPHVDAAARAGCEVALTLLRQEARWLALGFVNLQHLYAPGRIVVGGGVAAVLDLMLDPIAATMRERLLPGFACAEVRRATLGDDAGLVGAGLTAHAEAGPSIA